MKTYAYIWCIASWVVLLVMITISYCGYNIWLSNWILIILCSLTWTGASIYEYKKEQRWKNGK